MNKWHISTFPPIFRALWHFLMGEIIYSTDCFDSAENIDKKNSLTVAAETQTKLNVYARSVS